MPSTTYKGYTVPTTGTETGTWGDDINTNFTNFVDQNLGGIVTKTVAGSNITLSASESRQAMVRLTGSISAAVQVSTSCQGFTFVENLTTGSFQITFTNGVAGVVVPQGTRVTIFADATNGCRIVGANSGFATGISQTFFNASAPSGWTKSTSFDNGTMRIVSGTGGGTGGSALFTSVFSARTILQANIPNYNLTVTDPTHTHPFSIPLNQDESGFTNTATGGKGSTSQSNTYTTNAASTGISVNSAGSGTAMDFAVKYADAILCVVN